MNRIVVGVVVIVMTVGATIATVAAQTQTPTVTMQQSWTAWFVGSATGNPLHIPDDSCGELVDGLFLLAPGITGPSVERTCHIPSGVDLIISSIGGFSNTPTDGESGTKLFSAALGYFQGVVPKSVKAVVDGALVPKGPATCIDPFEMTAERGSFLAEIDRQVAPNDSVKVAICGQFYVLEPLSAGQHILSFEGKFKNTKTGVLTLNVTVP
jgi:hypothetical protein